MFQKLILVRSAHYYNFYTLTRDQRGRDILGIDIDQREWYVAFTSIPGVTGTTGVAITIRFSRLTRV